MSQMIDLAISPEEQKQNSPVAAVTPEQPVYPYGLSIRLDHDTLEKLGVDYDDWEVGDMFALKCIARLTSKSENDTTEGKRCCVEMQIIAMQGEDEEHEAA